MSLANFAFHKKKNLLSGITKFDDLFFIEVTLIALSFNVEIDFVKCLHL